MMTAKKLDDSCIRLFNQKRHLITKGQVFMLAASIQLAFEDYYGMELTVANDIKMKFDDYKGVTSLIINVDGPHFTGRQTVFYRGEDNYLELCFWCDAERARLILTAIYRWLVTIQ